MLSSEKEKEEKQEKRRKRKTDDKPRGIRACLHSRGAKEESEANDCILCLVEAVCQGFAGENDALRASVGDRLPLREFLFLISSSTLYNIEIGPTIYLRL